MRFVTWGRTVKTAVVLLALVAVGLYWRHWIHEQRALERGAALAQKRAAAARRVEWARRWAQGEPCLLYTSRCV